MKLPFFGVIIIAGSFGIMEASWTGPGRGGPVNTWMGVFALLLAFLYITWPEPWFIPGLAIFEEMTHLWWGYGAFPSMATIFNHWSTGYIGLNIYPYITFPLISMVGYIFRKWLASMERKLHELLEKK